MANTKPQVQVDKETGMRHFSDIFTQRHQEAGWNVVQAATLLIEGKKRKCGSLITYAALEFRLAIEQLIFTVIAVAKGTVDENTLAECRKKDGLFRILDEVSPKYSLRCKFTNALSSFYPGMRQIAEWDVRSLRRYYTDLSDLCHSQLIIRDVDADPLTWGKKISRLEEVYRFLEAGMKRGTGVLKVKGEDPVIAALWDEFSKGSISVEELKGRFDLFKSLLDSRRIIRP